MLMMDDYLSTIQNFYNISDNIIMQCNILADLISVDWSSD